jgi:hypothetical protein
MRFSHDTAASVLVCPFCGGPLDRLPAEQALGLRLMDSRKLDDRIAAVELELSRPENDWERP